MANFIKLTERHSKEPIYVNADNIQSFKSNHSEGTGWQFSHVVMFSHSFDVLETSEQFERLLAE